MFYTNHMKTLHQLLVSSHHLVHSLSPVQRFPVVTMHHVNKSDVPCLHASVFHKFFFYQKGNY